MEEISTEIPQSDLLDSSFSSIQNEEQRIQQENALKLARKQKRMLINKSLKQKRHPTKYTFTFSKKPNQTEDLNNINPKLSGIHSKIDQLTKTGNISISKKKSSITNSRNI